MNEKTDTNESTNTTDEIEPMRILRISRFPSLSGRSELTGHVGCNESNAIHFRIWANSAAGMFNRTWVSMADVSKLVSTPENFSSNALAELWKGASRNGPGFSLAHLLSEALVEKPPSSQRTYRTANPVPFLERINALIASDVDLKEDDEPSDALPMSAAATPKRGRPKKQSA